MLDWRGSTPVAIPLDPPTNLEGFAFGPDDLLYSPDIGNNQIVKSRNAIGKCLA